MRIGQRVRSAILLDPFFELPDPRKLEKAIAFKRRLFENEDRTLYSYYWVMAGFSPDFLERNFDVVDQLATARIASDRFVSIDIERWIRWVRALRTNWLTEKELAAIDVPTLVLATELDSWHAGPTIGMASALAARLRGAELKTIPGYGTFFFIEESAAAPETSRGVPPHARKRMNPERESRRILEALQQRHQRRVDRGSPRARPA